MKKSRKHRLVEQAIAIMKDDGLVIDRDSVQQWVMGHVVRGTHHAGKFGGLFPGDFSSYFREFYEDIDKDTTDQ